MSDARPPYGQGDQDPSHGPSLSKDGEQGGSGQETPGSAAPTYGAPTYGEPAPGSGSSPYDPQGGGYGGSDQQGVAYGGTGYGDSSQGYSSQGYSSETPSYDPQQGDQQAAYGAGAPGAAGGYGPYGAPGAYGGAGGTPPKKKNRTGLLIGLIAGGLVVVVALAIGLVVLLSGGGDKPSATVQAYLQALSDGNAEQALEQGEKPSDTTFATSATLKTQQDIAKISDIDVSDGYSSGNRARVTATYKFGNKQANESFSLTKLGGEWKLDDTVYQIDLSSLDDVPGLTLLGVETSGKSSAYVFPGPLTWGSSSEYYTITERGGDDDFTLSPSDGTYSYTSLETGLSDDGEQAVADALTKYITDCAASKSLEPDDCPQAEYDYEAVDGSATWTAPTDLSGLEYQTGSPVNEIYVSGSLTWSVTYTAQDYTGAQKQVTVDDVDGSIYGTVDLSADPPAFTD